MSTSGGRDDTVASVMVYSHGFLLDTGHEQSLASRALFQGLVSASRSEKVIVAGLRFELPNLAQTLLLITVNKNCYNRFTSRVRYDCPWEQASEFNEEPQTRLTI